MAKNAISQSEWLAELEKLQDKRSGGLTTEEWASKLGISPQTMLKKLKRAKAEGWLTATKEKREGLHGGLTTVPVYRVVKPGK